MIYPLQTCVHCEHRWRYKGKNKTKTTCPDCQQKTPLKFSVKKDNKTVIDGSKL